MTKNKERATQFLMVGMNGEFGKQDKIGYVWRGEMRFANFISK
ncbi:hypothetical protein [Hugenholtzia roseola]|nr:hypothetical protein [Hugenholtzia roseola]